MTHLVTVGGWDRPHPATSLTGAQWWAVWKAWNAKVASAAAVLGAPSSFAGFDGIDWDVEGVDTQSSSDNTFPLTLLHLMGDMSTAAKADGYSVSLTPCESYLDVYNYYFDFSLKHAYLEYPEFPYHGENTYAYLVAKYPDAWDIISVQLYESWSHANYQISEVKVPASAFLQMWARQIMHGWYVNFALTPGIDIASQYVKVPPQKLVLGLANGWTGSTTNSSKVKALYIPSAEVADAIVGLNSSNASLALRGVMFWSIKYEGMPISGSTTPVWLAKEMNDVLHVR